MDDHGCQEVILSSIFCHLVGKCSYTIGVENTGADVKAQRHVIVPLGRVNTQILRRERSHLVADFIYVVDVSREFHTPRNNSSRERFTCTATALACTFTVLHVQVYV